MNTIQFPAGKVKMIAHRGVSKLERENTCPAFIAAGNRSYFGIETDVHVTADGKFVVIHDETLTRVSAGAWDLNVEQVPYSQLEDVVLPDLDGSTHRKDVRIPLLQDYVAICKKYEKIPVLELKNPFRKEDICRLVEEIKAMDYLEKVIFISFSFENCRILREILPQQPVQFLTSKLTPELPETLKEHRMDLDVNYKALTEEWVKAFHEKGVKVNCWTCDDGEIAHSLVNMGVDFITTNILEGE